MRNNFRDRETNLDQLEKQGVPLRTKGGHRKIQQLFNVMKFVRRERSCWWRVQEPVGRGIDQLANKLKVTGVKLVLRSRWLELDCTARVSGGV